ncbi:MAG: hypothetical protein IPM69_15080 [Ignavibacteria bacterium]|nr:hypothetical protein [Ignavibacteria bacterium]
MSATEIKAVTSKSDEMKFIKCQWNFYKGDKNFVPPMIMDRKKLLDKTKNPFYKHSEMQLFLAERDGIIVGRIGAIINHNHNTTHEDLIGFFGFFECENNQQTANLLFATAAEWLKKRGMTHVRGPVNPSMNDECGLLVDGFTSPPVVLMTYNPEYYARLIEDAGFAKEKDLYAYILENKSYITDKMNRMVNVIRERNHITVREVNFKNKTQFEKDVKTLKDIYNAAWEKNWGFVKMTNEEFDFLAADLKQIADPRYALIIEIKGQPVGFALALPDINQCFIHNKNGGLLGGVWHLLTKKSKISLLRIIVLGVLPEYRRTGADAVMYYELGKRGVDRGITHGEASWILEDNTMMNRGLTTTMNGKVYKTYRVYQKEL